MNTTVKIKIRKKNIHELLFFLCIILFFFQHSFDIFFLDNISELLERYKFKYLMALICSVIYSVSLKFHFTYNVKEFRICINNLIILIICTLIFGNSHHIKNDLVNEILYFLVPIVFVFTLSNIKNGKLSGTIDLYYYVIIFGFFIMNYRNLSFSAIKEINFIESYSPFEKYGEPYTAFILMLYYRWKGDKTKCLVTSIVSFLSFKRIVVVALLLSIFPIEKLLKKINFNITKRITFFLLLFFPLLIQFIYSNSFSFFFKSLTNIDLNYFSKGRENMISIALRDVPYGCGLGAIRLYITDYYSQWWNFTGRFQYADIHCDIIRFYWECTIIGYYSIIKTYFSFINNWISYLVIVFVFLIASGTHVFGVGTTLTWILIYMVLFECKQENQNE